MARKPFRFATRRVKKLMRNMPDAAQAEIVALLEETAPRAVNYMKLRAPVRTGALSRGIKSKLLKKSLKLRVGLLGSPRARGKLFYGYILNYGRKEGRKIAHRQTKTGRSNYFINVKGIRATRFISDAQPKITAELQPKLRALWSNILKRAAEGSGK